MTDLQKEIITPEPATSDSLFLAKPEPLLKRGDKKKRCPNTTFYTTVFSSVKCLQYALATEKRQTRLNIQRVIYFVATKVGAKDVLDWAKNREELALDQRNVYSICIAAAFYGHLGILKTYLVEDGPWDSKLVEDSINAAAEGGQMVVLKYPLHDRGHQWQERASDLAAGNGHLEVLKFMSRNGDQFTSPYAIERAAAHGHLEVIGFLHKRGCPWDRDACVEAARNGHLEVLRRLYDGGCSWDKEEEWDDDIGVVAAANGRLEVLKYLHENKLQWNLSCVPRLRRMAISRH